MHLPRHFNVRVDDSEGEQGDDSRSPFFVGSGGRNPQTVSPG